MYSIYNSEHRILLSNSKANINPNKIEEKDAITYERDEVSRDPEWVSLPIK